MKSEPGPPLDPQVASLPFLNTHFMQRSRPLSGLRSITPRRLARLFLIACLCLMTACGDVEVATVPSEKEAIEILTLLFDNEIDAHKEEVGEEGAKQWKIIIDGSLLGSGDVAAAHRILQDHGLPRPKEEARKEDGGLLPTQMAEKAKYLREIEAKIENQLLLLPGVVRVKVNVAPFESDPIALKPPPATASALILCKDKEPGFTDGYVQNLVAGGVPQLEPGKVKVAIVYDPPHPPPRREASAARRSRLIAGGVIVGLLTILLGVLVYQVRRKKRQASASSADDAEEGHGEMGDPLTESL